MRKLSEDIRVVAFLTPQFDISEKVARLQAEDSITPFSVSPVVIAAPPHYLGGVPQNWVIALIPFTGFDIGQQLWEAELIEGATYPVISDTYSTSVALYPVADSYGAEVDNASISALIALAYPFQGKELKDATVGEVVKYLNVLVCAYFEIVQANQLIKI